MKLKAGIFWGGQDEQPAYQSASAILHKLDTQLFEPALFFVDQQQRIYAIDTDLFRQGGWELVNLIDPKALAQTINLAFVELWGADSQWLLARFSDMGIPFVGQGANLRDQEQSSPEAGSDGWHFSCLVMDQLDGNPLALYPRVDGPAVDQLTPLQLEQIRRKSLQLYQQLDLAPYAHIRGRYTADDLLLFDNPEMAYPLTEGGYLEQGLAPFRWTAEQCCTYSVLVSLRCRFRESPQQKAYQAIYEHLLNLCQQHKQAVGVPLAILIGAEGTSREVALEAARYFARVSREITDQRMAIYECLSAKSNTALRLISLDSAPADQGFATIEDRLYIQIKEATDQLKASFLTTQDQWGGAPFQLSDLKTNFAYLCLSGKFNSGFLQYALDEMNIPHSGTPLAALQKIDRIISDPGALEPGMVHLRSSLWCTQGSGVTVMGHSLIEKDGQVVTPARQQLLVLNDREVQRNIQQTIRSTLQPCLLRGYVVVESYLRIFEDNSVQLSVVGVEASPLLTPDHVLFAHARDAGIDPKAVFNRLLEPILIFDLASQKIRSVPTMVHENEEELEPIQEPNEPTSEHSAMAEEVAQTPEEEPGFFAQAWSNTKAFITSPIFLRNLGGIIIAGLLFFGLINLFLGMYTRHGSGQIIVDNYLDQTFEEARRKARGKGLKAVVTDSTFVIGMPPNMVIEQDPQPGSKVKKRRTVYLWVTGGQAPDVLLPNLAGKDDFDTYQRELDRRGIELTIKERQFDRKLEENTILGFYFQGEPVSLEQVRNGYKVPKGSQMQAIVSKRSDGMVAMPDLVCQTFEAANFELESNQLKLGEVYGTRSDQAYVWKQEPAYVSGERIPIGSTIVLHLTSELPAACQ
jgi:beta-lactam-binding protein with PASTA domain